MNRGIRATSLLIGLVLSLSACAEKEHYERIIVIDPGHGGMDPGAIGGSGNILEKEVTLRTALALRDQLEATGRYRVIMTRDDDRIVPLRDRLQIAQAEPGRVVHLLTRGQFGERARGPRRIRLHLVRAGLPRPARAAR